MLPVHNTTGIPAALLSGTYYADAPQLASATSSSDGRVLYTYDPTGQLVGADYSPLPLDATLCNS